jgi:hypothetical protein
MLIGYWYLLFEVHMFDSTGIVPHFLRTLILVCPASKRNYARSWLVLSSPQIWMEFRAAANLLSARFNVHATSDLGRRQSLALLLGNPMISLGRQGKRWENNIKMDLNKGSSVCTDLVQF